ncbi:hypothetical protein SEA_PAULODIABOLI_267 [Microbacterium phage PauloDiaboli]|nr:hypothetical protein SEA_PAULODIABOLI_267 [Microbacterium phage PauloDiaboli]
MPTEFDRILNFDPLLEAEKVTGKSYKEDPGTKGLGFVLLQESAQRKKDELMLREDTYSGMPFHDAVQLVLDLGFEPIYAQIKSDKSKYGDGRPVHFYLYWRKGVLLRLESYGSEDSTRGLTVNSMHMYYNWMQADGSTPWCPVSGSSSWTRMAPGFDGELEDDPWVMNGDKDVREGLKHYLEILHSSGIVPETWLYVPSTISLHSYAERVEDDLHKKDWFEKYDARNVERIKLLRPDIRDMMIAGRRGKSWDND